MIPLVSTFVLLFQLYLFRMLFIPFYLVLTAFQFRFSVPVLGCCLPKFIHSFMILKEINMTGSLNCVSFDIPKVQMCNMIKWSKLSLNHFILSSVTFT